ncbi:hypothetical protein OIU74_012394 [Salix koriyanagi]|uniref:Uncharacterized protein n=1 Tax=Salix koriyanagi TaxID=2511006 RepID=A0A9Q0Q6P9_9ROSI|nr:hypothetical protein OIU74_012394 [Salix koriyanagi]
MVESDKSTDSNLHNPIRLAKSRQILNNQEKYELENNLRSSDDYHGRRLIKASMRKS